MLKAAAPAIPGRREDVREVHAVEGFRLTRFEGRGSSLETEQTADCSGQRRDPKEEGVSCGGFWARVLGGFGRGGA